MEDAVDVLALEKFVKAGRISPHIPSGTLEKLLDDEVYVVTSVLKTKEDRRQAPRATSGAAVKVDVPIIQQAVGGQSQGGYAGHAGIASGVRGRGSRRVRVSGRAARLRRLRRVPDDAAASAGDAAARALPSAAGASSAAGARGPVFLEARGAFVRVAHVMGGRGDRETRDDVDPVRLRPESLARRSPADSRVRPVRVGRAAASVAGKDGRVHAWSFASSCRSTPARCTALTFSAPRHRPAWQLVRRLDFIRAPEQVEGDDLILRLMLVPDSPGTTDLPKGLGRLQQIASPFAAPGRGSMPFPSTRWTRLRRRRVRHRGSGRCAFSPKRRRARRRFSPRRESLAATQESR